MSTQFNNSLNKIVSTQQEINLDNFEKLSQQKYNKFDKTKVEWDYTNCIAINNINNNDYNNQNEETDSDDEDEDLLYPG